LQPDTASAAAIMAMAKDSFIIIRRSIADGWRAKQLAVCRILIDMSTCSRTGSPIVYLSGGT
jgi:hypothetical protein